MPQRKSAKRDLVEIVPGFIVRGEGISDLFAGKPAVFVAKHEHVEPWRGRMVHEVNRGVGRVAWGGHEECCRGAKRDDGVEGTEGEGEDSGRVVACKGHDSAHWRKVVSGSEVRADSSQVAASIFGYKPKLAFELGGADGTGC